ncbi:uncharacterized protein EKO05_0002573 [Ascochyta rabiei]|uniref:Uncharacterized protein n=1 Tax=Didymella rabiei TaxID=5454 RepID=A0A163IIQ1_DIDRA|nr:uncharacterized protein EKO05_0002573 [Ascochyta rabiei]KZM25777.1 hypothetical protein ST47_g3058 [Ascochyta rabiei]UPX11995.1 hypothetical protein EKO05_0002573 [Ascochyta rabiei]
MSTRQPDPYALLEDSFTRSPPPPARKHLSRRSDSYRQYLPAAAPLQLPQTDSPSDNDTDSPVSSQQSTPLASPRILGAADNSLPPTPPTISRQDYTATSRDPLPDRGSFVGSMASQKSALSTPVTARSPPTPDPSPPRTARSSSTARSNNHLAVDRPPLFPYPSSRAESFTTAREDLSSEPSISRSATPLVDRLGTVDEDRGLGLAFEQNDDDDDDDDVTPVERPRQFYSSPGIEQPGLYDADTMAGAGEDRALPAVGQLPDGDWNTERMRNVTVRRKRKPDSSPQHPPEPIDTMAGAASPTTSTRSCRSSGLRERVEASSSSSPCSPSIETSAQSIGWPAEGHRTPEEHHHDNKHKRMSTASVASTVIAAVVITTPPQRQRTLRHSGRNMALRNDSGSPLGRAPTSHSNRNSTLFDDVPLHKLVHKKATLAERSKRFSTDSETLGTLGSVGTARNASPFSVRSSRTIDSSAYTLAHQESVRNVLQPAADILSRSNLQARPDRNSHMRISSAPEPASHATMPARSSGFVRVSPQSPQRAAEYAVRSPAMSPRLPYTSPALVDKGHRRVVSDTSRPGDLNKPLPRNPMDHVLETAQRRLSVYDNDTEDKAPPPALLDRVRLLVAEREAEDEVMPTPTMDQMSPVPQQSAPSPNQLSSPNQSSPPSRLSPIGRGGSRSRGKSEERRRSAQSQDRTSPFQDSSVRHSFDRTSPEDFSRRSYDWQRKTPEEHRRISFDRSTGRTEEHANARHLYSQSTPFSQFSDTPIEVSEATAVSIYPHNNDSLLVVQQPSRVNSMMPEPKQLTDGAYFDPQDDVELRQELLRTPTPPFVDAIEESHQSPEVAVQPTLTLEPSTPPMQIDLPQPNGVDSPLENPRSAPEPPKIMFIPPTPAEELERPLEVGPPGPPKHSDAHPQRRLSLVQRARRYSDNFISPFLARASSNRGRYYSDSHSQSQSSHRNPDVPSVNEEDGTLHPFWRPRGFWDGFEDSDSDDEDNVLPSGGDTSDVEDPEPESYPRRNNTLRKRLTSGFQGSGGFLIGNSLGVQRHGTNRRRHHIALPPHFLSSPKTSQHTSSPTQPLRPQSSGVRKSGSRSSLRSSASFEQAPRRQSWRKGKSIPGLKGYQVQYIGVSGIKDRLKERTAEKRRDKIRKSIGSRYYVEPNVPMSTH